MFNKRNLITYVIAFWIILLLNFLLPRMMPGDPFMAIYGDEALVRMTPELKAQIIHRFALNQSLIHQFWAYLWNLFHGDLGYSYYYNTSVWDIVLRRLPWTLLLVGSSVFLATIIGMILGIESGWRHGNKLDKSLLGSLTALGGFPDFFIGIVLLIIFGVTLGWFPLAGAVTPYADLHGIAWVRDVLKHLFLPMMTLTLCHIGGGYLLTRNTMVNVIREPYIQTARAKGLSDTRIRYRHAGRNAIIPLVTRTGIWLGQILTGVFFVESIYAYPGLGNLTYDALTNRDYPVLQGVLVLMAVIVLCANFLVDLLLPKLDPRVAYAR
jgi:peptide/nickel transport system permease protein